jgi:hypothetical protein
MKNLLSIIFSVTLLIGCKSSFDQAKAKEQVNLYMAELKKGNAEGLAPFFGGSEAQENAEKVKSHEQLFREFGKPVSVDLKETKMIEEGEEASLLAELELKLASITLTEALYLQKDEGKYVIAKVVIRKSE